MQKCKCLCARRRLLLWGAVASVVDDRCHAGGGRQNGDMWEWEQAENRSRANMPQTHRTENPTTAVTNAFLKAFKLPTLQLIVSDMLFMLLLHFLAHMLRNILCLAVLMLFIDGLYYILYLCSFKELNLLRITTVLRIFILVSTSDLLRL